MILRLKSKTITHTEQSTILTQNILATVNHAFYTNTDEVKRSKFII